MHIQAEIWVAAHFEYTERWNSVRSQDSYWVKTIKKIVENGLEGGEFMSEMTMNVFSDQIFVFTPKWDIITLPKWATPVDFAYAIHSKVGNELTIAKVNGQVVPLDYVLHNGESVQIVTDTHRKPNPTWLSFVKTPKARDYIRQFINRKERSFFIEKWRFILNSYLEHNYGKWLDKELSLLKNLDGKSLDTRQKEDVLVQLGNLSRKPTSVLRSINDVTIKAMFWEEKIAQKPQKKDPIEKIKKEDEDYVIIWKERNITHKMALCCSPKSWDRIVWAIGKGIVTIHRFDCKNIERISLARRIPARWSKAKIEGVTIAMDVSFYDKRWLLRQITEIFYQTWLNIDSLSTENLGDGKVLDHFVLKWDNEDYYLYERLIERFRFDIPEMIESKLISLY